MKNAISYINRRKFLKASVLISAGLLIPFAVHSTRERKYSNTFSPNAFLHIGEDDTITVILTKVEMGQSIWTTLPMLIAEELDCDMGTIKIKHSPVSADYNHTSHPAQMTVGSSSTSSEFDRYRYAGATARAMLVEAAARKFGVSAGECTTENGSVLCGNQRVSYGKLASEASKLSPPVVQLRERKDWKILGRSQVRLDGPEKVNGVAKYGIDVMSPDLLIAVVAHPPSFGGRPVSIDSSKAKAVKDVVGIVPIPTGVAVLGKHYWAARRGCDALKIEWDGPAGSDSDEMLKQYRSLSHTTGTPVLRKGDAALALGKSVKAIVEEYSLPYLAHAAMEPLNCTVRIEGDGCEIWTGTQLPTSDRLTVASILNFKLENVKIYTPFLGGSFGRRGSLHADWIVEAVHIARVSGKAIKMIWSREDDMRAGYYRPAYLHRVAIATADDGLPTAWQHRIVGQSVFSNTFAAEFLIQNGVDGSSIEGIVDSPYVENVPHLSVELHTTINEVPVLPWRSVGFSQTCFVMETVIDELAYKAKTDPLEFRMRLCKGHSKYLRTMSLAAEKSRWSHSVRGIYRGIAVNSSHGSCVAQVVELSVDGQQVTIHRVVCAIDCGFAVNPDGVCSQLESAVVFALTAAVYGEITLENGQVKQGNFHEYRMLRMNQMPIVEVHIVPSSEPIGGAGEPGVPAVAPALANALFSATGKRFRNLPIKGLKF